MLQIPSASDFEAQRCKKKHILYTIDEYPLQHITKTHLANGPWKKSLNFDFPIKYVIPKSIKFSNWPSKKKRLIKHDKSHHLWRPFITPPIWGHVDARLFQVQGQPRNLNFDSQEMFHRNPGLPSKCSRFPHHREFKPWSVNYVSNGRWTIGSKMYTLYLCKNDNKFPLRNVTYSYQRVTSQMIQVTALTFFDSWCMFILQHLESLLQLFPFCCGVFPEWKTTRTFCVLTHGWHQTWGWLQQLSGTHMFFFLALALCTFMGFIGHMKHCNRTYNIGSMVRICRRIWTRMVQSLNTFCKWVKEPFHDDHSSYSVYTCIYIYSIIWNIISKEF